MTWQEDAKVVRQAVSSAMVGEWGQNEAFDALARLTAALEAAKNEVSLTCVAKDSYGVPFETVKLLGDREAIDAVVQMRDRGMAAEQRVAELEAALREIAVSGALADRVGIARAALGEK